MQARAWQCSSGSHQGGQKPGPKSLVQRGRLQIYPLSCCLRYCLVPNQYGEYAPCISDKSCLFLVASSRHHNRNRTGSDATCISSSRGKNKLTDRAAKWVEGKQLNHKEIVWLSKKNRKCTQIEHLQTRAETIQVPLSVSWIAGSMDGSPSWWNRTLFWVEGRATAAASSKQASNHMKNAQKSDLHHEIWLEFWWMIPMSMKYNHTKFEQETQQCRPGTGIASGGPQFQILSKLAKKCHFAAGLGVSDVMGGTFALKPI